MADRREIPTADVLRFASERENESVVTACLI
jgi:hypothetical protein